jgi:hypothetical protein
MGPGRVKTPVRAARVENILEKLHVMRTDNAVDIRLDAILENYFFYIFSMYEFSHSLDQIPTYSVRGALLPHYRSSPKAGLPPRSSATRVSARRMVRGLNLYANRRGNRAATPRAYPRNSEKLFCLDPRPQKSPRNSVGGGGWGRNSDEDFGFDKNDYRK